jgi:hypothetical protein
LYLSLKRHFRKLTVCAARSTPYPGGSPLSDIRAADANITCTREQLWGTAGFDLCLANGAASQHICQQRVYSAGLYVAGTALVGLALLSALVALGLGVARAVADHEAVPYAPLPRSEHADMAENGAAASTPSAVTPAASTWRNFALALGVFLAALAALCLFVAHDLAFNSLVEDQAPSGDAALSNPLQGNLPTESPWYLSYTGVVYASMAWLMAGVGVLIASLGACLGGL